MRPLLAILGAGVFLVHPLQTESVAYIAGRSELLSGLFVLAAMLLFLSVEGRMRWLWAFAIFALAAAGLLAKEQALVVGGCFLLFDSGWASAELSLGAALRRNLRDHWRLYALLVVFGAAGSMLVFQVLHSSRSAGFGLKDITWHQYFLAECRSIFLYIRLFIVPIGQSADHGVTVTRGALDIGGVAGLVALAALLRAAARYRRAAPLAGFGLLLFLLLLAPTSSFVPLADPVAEHRMYLPILGLIIISLDAVSRMRVSASALRVSGMVVIGLLVMATMARSQVWSGAAELAEDTVNKSPNAIRGYKMLSLALMEENRCAQLVKALDAGPRKVLEKDASVLLGWAYGYECMGRLDVALDYFKKAGTVREDAFVEAEIGRVEARLGRATESLTYLNRSIQLQPEFDMAYCYRGYWHLAASDPVSARQDFQRALALNGRNRFAAAGLRQANGEAPVTSASETRY